MTDKASNEIVEHIFEVFIRWLAYGAQDERTALALNHLFDVLNYHHPEQFKSAVNEGLRLLKQDDAHDQSRAAERNGLEVPKP